MIEHTFNRASDRVGPKMGNCVALWRSIVRQKIPIVLQIVRQSTVNFKCFFGGGVLNGVLIEYRCILVYFSDGIDTISWNHMLFYFGVKYSKDYVTYIFQKIIHPSPPLLRTKLLERIMSKILHINLFTCVYKCTNQLQISRSMRNTLSSYEVICITRQKYKVEQLPILWNMENNQDKMFA